MDQRLDIKGLSRQSRPVIDRELIKGARHALGWTVKELASRASLGVATIRRAEAGGLEEVTEGSMLVIERAFRDAGVVFIEENQASLGGGRGFRLRRKGKRK